MVFSSPIFLFAFLPLVYILYQLMPKLSHKNALLAAASLVFYSFGQLYRVPLFIGSILLNYCAGLLLMVPKLRHRKAILTLAVLLNLGILGVYKYTDFIIENLNGLLHTALPLPGIELPIGISFFTFQGMSYVIDVYRDRTSGSRSLLTVLLYISFFPQLIAGPIVKYHDIAEQISSRNTTVEDTALGICRFIAGLGKKVLLSNPMGFVADAVFNRHLAAGMDYRLAWLGGICYMMQIYFDFSGYSDMAIGMSRMFGFRLKENFNYPYAAVSIRDFWRRWHISLSTWFREYLYIPLGGNRMGKTRAAINRMIVFLCTGIWHGANYTFILWGVLHGILSALEDFGVLPTERLSKSPTGRLLSRCYTLLCVMLLFVLFRADTVADAWTMVSSMFLFRTAPNGSYLLHSLLTGSAALSLLGAIVLCGGIAQLSERRLRNTPFLAPIKYAASLAILLLSIMSLSQGGFNPFIYFQF
ncbi:MAG: MBOAT family protein [Oscillospiraceae bacterium]|nr:MBOAT family protein [Oscillospiraceae bacterium]